MLVFLPETSCSTLASWNLNWRGWTGDIGPCAIDCLGYKSLPRLLFMTKKRIDLDHGSSTNHKMVANLHLVSSIALV
jgi:hypothetical protein